MKKEILGFAALLTLASAAQAHFGIVVPDQSMVMDAKSPNVTFNIAFAHPMEQSGMTMAKPVRFAAIDAEGKAEELTGKLQPSTYLGKASWKNTYRFKRPGVTQFVMQPQPYWEPAEDKFIVHYTKVIVPSFGEEDGWDRPAGLATEIIPLTRPFANYAGNTFRGQVLLAGKPVAGCDVEVEFLNEGAKREAPNDYFVTQVVKTDDNGVFVFTAPWAGWWGFAALNDAPEKRKMKGEEKDVELGAVLWTEFAPHPASK